MISNELFRCDLRSMQTRCPAEEALWEILPTGHFWTADRSDRQWQTNGCYFLPRCPERCGITDCQIVTIIKESFPCKTQEAGALLDDQRENRRTVVILRNDEVRLFTFAKDFCRKKTPSITLKQTQIRTHERVPHRSERLDFRDGTGHAQLQQEQFLRQSL